MTHMVNDLTIRYRATKLTVMNMQTCASRRVESQLKSGSSSKGKSKPCKHSIYIRTVKTSFSVAVLVEHLILTSD